MLFQFPAHEDESKNTMRTRQSPCHWRIFLLTFAVEHVQHGFSDFARSYCTMDTPRRQLLLQMFFFFFLWGGVYINGKKTSHPSKWPYIGTLMANYNFTCRYDDFSPPCWVISKCFLGQSGWGAKPQHEAPIYFWSPKKKPGRFGSRGFFFEDLLRVAAGCEGEVAKIATEDSEGEFGGDSYSAAKREGLFREFRDDDDDDDDDDERYIQFGCRVWKLWFPLIDTHMKTWSCWTWDFCIAE